MAEAEARKPVPAITPEAKPFWEAAAQQKLKMQRCNNCGAWIWTPRPSCFECGSEVLEWTDMSGRGEVYSFTVIRQIVGRGSSQAICRNSSDRSVSAKAGSSVSNSYQVAPRE